MPNRPSLSDLGISLETALEKLRGLDKELETAAPEEKLYINTCIKAVKQDIDRFNGAIRDQQR